MLKNKVKILIIFAFAIFYFSQASLLAGEHLDRVKYESGEIDPEMDDETESDYPIRDYENREYREYNEEKNSFQGGNKNKIAKKNKKICPDKKKINKQSIEKRDRGKITHNNHTIYSLIKGDTLYRISKKFNVPIPEICNLNNIDSKTTLQAGFKLKIPIRDAVNKRSGATISENTKCRFRWPLKKILSVKRDGMEGIKPLGIIITSRPSSSVISSAPGIVKKIGFMRGYGRYIVIKHSGKYLTVYSNMNEISVREGDKIEDGGIIGKIDQSDRKLHFQINFSGKAQDPLRLLPKM